MTRKVSVAIAALAAVGLVGCSASSQTAVQQAMATPAGQLFCAIQTGGGGAIVAGIVDGAATAANPALGAVAVIATGATKANVDADCAQAAKNVGGVAGVPVSPPANPAAAPSVAVTNPSSVTQ